MLHENRGDSRERFRNDTVMPVRGSRKLLVKQIQKSGSWACEKIQITISSFVEVCGEYPSKIILIKRVLFHE